MATRRPLARNNYLEEAMALLIHNQAAFVEQIARNDQERLKLQRNFEEGRIKNEEWQRKTEARLVDMEVTLAEMPKTILRSVLKQLPQIIAKDVVKAVLEQLPKAIKREIGFKSPTTR
jgi:pyruvate/oxaloacetate carboxyltransferase